MSLGGLLELIRQPVDQPGAPSGRDWSGPTNAIGIDFPPEYVELVDTLGSGCLDGFIWLLSPFAGSANLNLVDQLERQTAMLSALRGESTDVHLYSSPSPESVPYPLWPADGGLIPWFLTDNGDFGLFVATRGGGAWPTVIVDARVSTWQKFDVGPVHLLYGILSGHTRPSAFPADFPPVAHSFQPAE